jgi:hypothetical protein
MKDPKEIADKYFERYTKLADLTTRIILITLLVLLTNWLFIVESNYAKYKAIKQEYSYKFQAIENRFIILNQQKADDLTAANKIQEEKEQLTTQKEELAKQKESSLKEQISEIKDVPSLIKFIFFISDNLEKGGLILNILFFIFLIYILFTRRVCLKYLAKALRIYKIEPTLQINQYKDFNLSSPFWLTPLPRNLNKEVEPKELKTILGWTFTHRFWKTILITTLIVILLIQIRLAYISFIVTGSKFNFIFSSGVTLVILTALVITYWLLPIKVEDNFNYEPGPNPVSRKDFIVLSSFGLFSLAFYKFSPLLPKIIHKRVPRFRAKKLKFNFTLSGFRNVFISNKKSKIIYFIDGNGKSICFDSFTTAHDFDSFSHHIEPFTDISNLQTGRKKPRLRRGHSSWHAENFALEKIKSNDLVAAVNILIYATKQNIDNFTPSYRLHDLLALICIRHNTSVPDNTWQKFIELSNNSKDKQLIVRVKKWNDTKWRENKLKKDKVIFAGIPI